MVRDTRDKHPNYFEAVLQLRDVSQEVLDWVEDEMFSTKVVVSKVSEVKNGFDFYLADNNQAKALGKKLQQKFGGEFQVTSSLHTKKDGKDVYRITILFREAPFRKGDIVDYHDDRYEIKSMSKAIYMQDLKSGKKIHVKYDEMSRIKKVEE